MNQTKENSVNIIRNILKITVFFFLVVFLCETGYQLSLRQNNVLILWFPLGFQFVVFLICKQKLKKWLLASGIAAGFIAGALNNVPVVNNLFQNLLHGLSVYFVASFIKTRYCKNASLENIRDYLYLIVMPAFLLPFFNALIERNITLFQQTQLSITEAEVTWFAYSIGFFVFTPLVLSWRNWTFLTINKAKKTEIVLCVFLFISLAVFTYFTINGDLQVSLYEEFTILFFVTVITYRYGLKGASLALFIIAFTTIYVVKAYLNLYPGINEVILAKITLLKSLFVTTSLALVLFAVILKQNKISEFNLQNSNSLLNATLESTEDAILTVDISGRLSSYNKKFLELWRIPLDLAETKDDRKLISFVLTQLADPEEFVLLVEYLYANPSKESLDIIQCNDGRIYERYSKPQKIEETIVGRVWSFRDITEQRRTEEALKKSRDSYLKVLDDSPALIWRAGNDAKCNWFNKAWLEFTGKPLENELGDGWVEGVYPDDVEECVNIYMKHFNSRTAFVMEYRIRRNDGEYRWIIDHGKPNYSLDNEFIGYIGYCFDITERKNAEKKLIDSERLTRELLSNVPEIIVVHINGIVMFMNKTGEKVMGFREDEVLGKHIQNFFEPSQYFKVYENMVKRMAGHEIDDYEVTLKTKQGNSKNVIIRAVQVNFNGQKAILAILVDITEKKVYETKLEELNATKDKLLSIISHDLKGPFQGFLGVSDLLANQIETLSSDEIKTMATELNLSLQKQYQLLLEILNWTKLQSNGIKFTPMRLNLLSEVENVIRGIEVNAARKEIKLKVAVNSIQFLRADPNMLQVLLRNLISNAIKFSYRGGSIKITSAQRNNSVIISVKDNGVGIDKEDYEKLFNINTRFTNDGTENEQGTGLGLIFCKELMEKHNGKIMCESKPGKGSTFNLIFPFI